MKKKFIKTQGLAKLNVLIQDTSETSPKYFMVSEMPEFLSSGLNSFKFSIDSNNLVSNSQIYVEILDTFGNPIYTEIPSILDEANKKLVSIYIYDDTPPGKALISIVGTTKTTASGMNVSEVVNNVRWSKVITVKPNERNNSPIIFKNPPTVNIIEVFKNISSGSYISGSTITLKNNDMVYSLVGNNAIVEVSTITGNFNKEMIGNTINFILTSSMWTEPSIPNDRTYTFSTTIKDVLTNYKIILTDPIIIDTERLQTIVPPVWESNNDFTKTLGGSISEDIV